MTTNIGYDVLVSCNEQLVADFASDPGGNLGVLFQNHTKRIRKSISWTKQTRQNPGY